MNKGWAVEKNHKSFLIAQNQVTEEKSDSTGSSTTIDSSSEEQENENAEAEERKEEAQKQQEAEASAASGAATSNLSSGPQDADALIETEEVVSTRLKKIDMGGPSPEVTISAEEISKAGYNSISDMLRDNPVTATGSRREQSGLADRAGMSTVDLKGLGSENTLVLINGIRMAPISGADSVDMNRIPVSMVKEIKIIKDDMSSIYGSDAIGGVVDIITHDSYSGMTIKGGGTVTELGGGERYDVSLVGGSSSATTNIVYSLGMRKNKRIWSYDRDWSNSGISTIGSPGGYRDVGNPAWSVDPACPPGQIQDNGPGGQACSFRHTDYSSSLPDISQFGAFTRIEHKVSDFVTFYSEAFFNRNQARYTYAPAPGIFNVPAAVADTYGLPDHVNGNDMEVRYRVLELGNRETYQENNFLGLTSGFRWDFLDTWTARLAGSYGREKNDSIMDGNAITSKLEQLVADGAFNPFAPAGSRGDLSSAIYQSSSYQIANFYFADLSFEGELFEIFERPFVLTTGYNYMFRDYQNKVDDISVRGEAFTGAGADGGAERTVHSLYVQLTGKVASNFDLYLSGRYDHYNDFGSTVNPKLGFKFMVTEDLLWRATVGTGFKAPQLASLYSSRSESYETFIDRYACENVGGTACNAQQYRVISGGNEDLNEITSFSYNTGLVYNPSTNLDVSFDFWSVAQKGLIWGGTGAALEEVTRAELAGVNPLDHGVNMNRDASGLLDHSNPIVAPSMNLTNKNTAGLDIGLTYKVPVALGVISVANTVTYRLWDKLTPFPGVPERDYVKEHWVNRWRNSLRLGYRLGDHDIGLTAISTDKYRDTAKTGFVDGFTRFDLAYVYSGFANSKGSLTVGIQNLLSKTPPLDPTDPNNPMNTYLYSEVGPLLYSNFTYHF